MHDERKKEKKACYERKDLLVATLSVAIASTGKTAVHGMGGRSTAWGAAILDAASPELHVLPLSIGREESWKYRRCMHVCMHIFEA